MIYRLEMISNYAKPAKAVAIGLTCIVIVGAPALFPDHDYPIVHIEHQAHYEQTTYSPGPMMRSTRTGRIRRKPDT